MYPIYLACLQKDTAKLLRYKENFPFLDEKGYAEYYEIAARTPLSKRPTDLNSAGIKFILRHIKSGNKVLEAGCGRGFMAREMQKITPPVVVGLDIEKPADVSGFTFVEGSLTNLPFDVVTCSHVLEHVVDFEKCLLELIRVARRQVVIVLPRQREYRYVADLHIRFFPYEYNVRACRANFVLQKLNLSAAIGE